jgi:hypothetical protein
MYKGLRGTSFVEIDTWAESSCEAPFTKGGRYLVYAKRADGGRILTSLCMGSIQVWEAAEDLRFLESWMRNRTTTSIEGEVFPDNGQGNHQSYDHLSKRLRGSRVKTVGTDGHQYSAVADSTGRFLIAPVRPGSYRLTVTQTKFRSGSPEYAVNVPEGGCANLIVPMGLDGKVDGRPEDAIRHYPALRS